MGLLQNGRWRRALHLFRYVWDIVSTYHTCWTSFGYTMNKHYTKFRFHVQSVSNQPSSTCILIFPFTGGTQGVVGVETYSWQSCQSHCKSTNVKFFVWSGPDSKVPNKCYCKTVLESEKRKLRPDVVSGEAVCKGNGKLQFREQPSIGGLVTFSSDRNWFHWAKIASLLKCFGISASFV